MSNLKKIEIEDFLYTFRMMQMYYVNCDHPVPEIYNITPIKKALEMPFSVVFGKTAYWGFYKKASCYFYIFTKGHLLANGNKRTGVQVLNLFYGLNNRQLVLSERRMYDLSIYVAKSEPEDKEKVITHITDVLKRNTIHL